MDILEELDTLRLGPSEYKIVQKAYTEIERLRERVKELATALEFEANYDGHIALARSALQQTQSSHAQMSDDKGQR